MGPGWNQRAVVAAFACAVVLLTPEGADARPRKKAAPPKDVSAPLIEHSAITTHSGSPPVAVRATITDDSGVFEPTLVVRKVGGAYARVPMVAVESEPGVFAADVPPELLDADLEYLIEAFDTNGNGPARAGAEDAPLVVVRNAPLPPEAATLAPATTAPPPVAEEEGSATPLLIGAGVAVGLVVLAGAGVAVAAMLYASREPDPTRTRVTVEGPAPVAALLAESHAGSPAGSLGAVP
jgi:hypothetical protein